MLLESLGSETTGLTRKFGRVHYGGSHSCLPAVEAGSSAFVLLIGGRGQYIRFRSRGWTGYSAGPNKVNMV